MVVTYVGTGTASSRLFGRKRNVVSNVITISRQFEEGICWIYYRPCIKVVSDQANRYMYIKI